MMNKLKSLFRNSIIIPSILIFIFSVNINSWELVWSEEFNNTFLNPNFWEIEINCEGGGNNELQCYTNRSQNIQVSDGNLIITAIPEHYQSKSYTSGRVRLKTDGFKYGKYVIRARLPKGKHLWPAIWMLPTKPIYGTWAASGEIDIMEYRGQNTSFIEGTLHFGGQWPNNIYKGSGVKDFGINFSADFHEFSIEWDCDEIRWFVDNQQFHNETLVRSFWSNKGDNPYTSIRQPFDQKFQFVFNVAVGGNFFGHLGKLTPEEAKSWPKPSLEIDFVRVYQNNSAYRTFCSNFFGLLVLYNFCEWLLI